MTLDADAVRALADRILTSTLACVSKDFARGVCALRDAVVRAADGGITEEALAHPEVGMRVRFASRQATGLVERLEVHDGQTSVGVRVDYDQPRGGPTVRRHRLKLSTWRRWVRGARLLPRRDPG